MESANQTIQLQPEPLTKEAFSSFGDVISVDENTTPIMINEGTTERFHKLTSVKINSNNASSKYMESNISEEAIISIFRAQPRFFPMHIKMMERHPLGSQAFLPSNDYPYLVLVCSGEDAPDPSTLRLFITKNVGVNYHVNTWHYPLIGLDKVNHFWVIDRSGPGMNLEEQDFSCEIDIIIHKHDIDTCLQGME